ncbi:pro-Pol polyprotein [Clonorchis sinensis]|uniref:Pro-Pol polyprotein n=1 Tax=Clonorchis sinensis TaxID=79923 RepID=G7YPV6_CLOSI|nr:pro-Pol polyprotein [Clonorchis sinensis]
MIEANSLAVELDPGKLVQLQRQDPVFRKVAAALLDGRSFENGEGDKELETFQSHFDPLSLNEAGIISWNATDSYVVLPVIPRVLRRKLIVQCHEIAHTGCAKMYDLLRQRTYWPAMRSEVMDYVVSCKRCRLMKEDTTGATHPMERIPVSEIAELWSVDIMGPFPVTTSGNQYIVIMTEHLSRWIEAAAVPNQRATTISGLVMHHIVANHGVPNMILTDQGPCFESKEFRNCLQKLRIRRLGTAPYHPQTNGLTEPNNRKIKEWLAAKGGDWEVNLPMVLLAHRAFIQPTTGKSPFMLMYGRHPRLPVDQEIGLWPTTRLSPEELDEERRKARENLTTVQKRTRQKTASRKARSFPIGAKVKWKDHQNPGRSGLGSRKLGS